MVEPLVGAPIDANGNLTSDGSRTFEWDAKNQLVRVLENGAEQVRFTYDGWGRRATKTASRVVRTFLYDTDGVIQERIGDTGIVSYAQNSELDKPLGHVENGAATFYVQDHLRSVVAWTDVAGTPIAGEGYDPFGRLTLTSGTAGYAYTGREWDEESGLYYNRARYYSADLGRFLSVDPLPVTIRASRELNDYAYVANDPLTFTDPYGLNIYGNYCGPGGKGKAIDATDSCCQQHDQCYGKCGADWRNQIFGTGGQDKQCCMQKCDQSMCQCLAKVQPKTDAERTGRSRVMWYFGCSEPKKPSTQQPAR